jgi:zinc protease
MQGADFRVQDRLIPLLYAGSPFAWRNTIGEQEGLRTLTAADVLRFHDTWYRPERMAIIAVGSFDAAQLESEISRRFKRLKAPTRDTPPAEREPRVPAAEGLQVITANDPELDRTHIELRAIRTGPEGPNRRDYWDFLRERMVTAILQERVDSLSRTTPQILSALVTDEQISPVQREVSLTARTTTDNVEIAVDALAAELQRALLLGFTEAELVRARRRELGSFQTYVAEQKGSPSDEVVLELIRHFIEDEPVPGAASEYEMAAEFLPLMTTADLHEILKGWFPADRESLVVISPGAIPPDAELQSVVAAARARAPLPLPEEEPEKPLMAELPEPGSVVSERTFGDEDITEWILSNGTRVLLRPGGTRGDEVLIVSTSPGGLSVASDEDLISARAAIAIAEESGIGEMDAVQYIRWSGGRQLWVGPYIDQNWEGVRAAASASELESVLQLIHLAYTAPRFETDSLTRLRADQQQRIQDQLNAPEAALMEKRMELLWGDHPRIQPWWHADPGAFQLEVAEAFYRQRMSDAGDDTVVIVGNLDLATLRPLVERYLATLPSAESHVGWQDRGILPHGGGNRAMVYQGTAPQALVMMDFPLKTEGLTPAQLEAIEILIGRRLFTVLREQQNSVYAVDVDISSWTVPAVGGLLTVQFACDPALADFLTSEVRTQLSILESFPSARGEVMSIQSILLEQVQVGVQEARYWLETLLASTQRGVAVEDVFEALIALPTMTPGELQSWTDQMLDVADYVEVIRLPESARPEVQP